MTNEQIATACERAEGLANSVQNDLYQVAAFSQILMHLLSRAEDGNQEGQSAKASAPGRQAAGPKKKAGLKARLTELQSDGFFATARNLKATVSELANLGWHHQPKEVSARLVELAREKVLRRSSGAGGDYLYSNW